ncbi:hypothetical protein QM012_009381 [Aureobasidium pullulans]|uniref:DUF3835 domain-containing protein n=1 Tax=Aureobasidium pullulans TaxID=5580 RepID=A0ABR0TI22_AURPU
MSSNSCPSGEIEKLNLSASREPGLSPSQFGTASPKALFVQPSGLVNSYIIKIVRRAWTETADAKWQQWSERDFHPAVEAYNEYIEPAPEMIVLENVNENLQKAGDALESTRMRLSQAQRTLELSIHPSGLQGFDLLLAQTKEVLRDIFEDINAHLQTIDQAQKESQEQMESLRLAVKTFIRSREVAENSKKKREADDEKMIDTVSFLEECLDNHCGLVNLILEKPEPLVKEGTDLIQAMLSEMFGLPIDDCISQNSEVDLEPIFEAEAEVESEVEFLWEKTETDDTMEIDQHDEPEPKLNASDNHLVKESSKLVPETMQKSRRYTRPDKYGKARAALYERFGLSDMSNPSADQEGVVGDQRNKSKRQNTTADSLNESPGRSPTPVKKLPALSQIKLSFNKVCLVSRKELSQKNTVREEKEQASPRSVRRNPRRSSARRRDYRENGLLMYGWRFE